MTEHRLQRKASRPVFRLGALSAATLGLLACLAFTGFFSQADGKSNRRVVLGATTDRLAPNCGTGAANRACIAEGKVTGFQVFPRGASRRGYVVPFDRAKVVAWSIQLSNPTSKDTNQLGPAQRPYFNRLFGSPSQARISILRPVKNAPKYPPRYRLIRSSGTQTLNRYFGSEVKFAIKPLNVMRGDVVALTIPTWAPAFWVPRACNITSSGDYLLPARCAGAKTGNTWRASRGPDYCGIGTNAKDLPNEALQKSRPHGKANSVRAYGCYYDGGRLLYKATVVAR